MTDALFTAPVTRTEADERFTPRWIFNALGEQFDLDPAHPDDHPTHVPTAKFYTRQDDGLIQPWHGFVWCNPPFSRCTAFADRFVAHGHGLWLGPLSNGAWVHRMLRSADRIWLMRDFAFVHPLHKGRRSSMPLAMFGYGDRAATALDRASTVCPDAGVIVIRPSHNRKQQP